MNLNTLSINKHASCSGYLCLHCDRTVTVPLSIIIHFLEPPPGDILVIIMNVVYRYIRHYVIAFTYALS